MSQHRDSCSPLRLRLELQASAPEVLSKVVMTESAELQSDLGRCGYDPKRLHATGVRRWGGVLGFEGNSMKGGPRPLSLLFRAPLATSVPQGTV